MLRLKRLGWSLAFIYAGVTIGMMFLERMLIYPVPSSANADWHPDWFEYEDAEFKSADGTQLHGWFLEHPAPQATLLVFHGNGEQVAYMAEQLVMLRTECQANVMAMDYRGYGKSSGKPFERGVLEDGEAAQQWLAERTGQTAESIVLLGHSLGGAVAVHVAAKHGARGLVLDRTFDSLVNVAAVHMPLLPVRLLLRNRYESAKRILEYHGPLLQFHGEADNIVPFKFGKQLFDSAPSAAKAFVSSPTLGHNDAWPSDFQLKLQEFLDSLPN
jgi:uncharacterized protein